MGNLEKLSFWVEGNWGKVWKEKRIVQKEEKEGMEHEEKEEEKEKKKMKRRRKRKRKRKMKRKEEEEGEERIHAANLLKFPLVKSKLTLRLRWHYRGCTATKRLLEVSR